MPTRTKITDEELLRSMRPPELRDMPDVLYEAIVKEANRIASAQRYIERTRRSMKRARRGLADDTWPSVWTTRWDSPAQKAVPDLEFNAEDVVTLCWLIDVCGRAAGFTHLRAIYVLAKRYHDRPYAWNHVHEWSIIGSLRSYSHAGLVTRVAPVTWALTDTGRDLLDVVFS